MVSDPECARPSGEPRYDYAVIAGMERLAPDRYPDVLGGVLEFLEVGASGRIALSCQGADPAVPDPWPGNAAAAHVP